MEVIGKAPRAAKQRGDYLIIERRRQEKIRSDNEVQKSYFETTFLKSKFELDTDRKITTNKLDEYVSSRMRKTEADLEARRHQLQKLLTEEKRLFTEELLAKQETAEQREAKMKMKAENMKTLRQQEQKVFVARKLQQQWHNNCDDLRGAHSRVAMREALAVRNKQMEELKQKAELLKEDKIRDAHLWEQDRQRKIAREEADNLDRIKRNKEMVECLSIQMEALRKSRENQENLKKQKAELVKEYMLNQSKQEVQNAIDKHNAQTQRRIELDVMSQQKREKMVSDREAELKSDLEMLQLVLEGLGDEKDRDAEKERLRKESMMYQQYVTEMAGWRRQQQQELNRILAAETDKAFKAKLAATDKQAAARQSLMQEVLRIRQKQIQEKLLKNEKQMELNAKEAEEMQKDISAYKQQEKETGDCNLLAKQQYKRDLDGQQDFARQGVLIDNKLIDYEYEQAKKNEEHYQRCLKSELARMLETP